jgi:hypothetical protein
LRELLAIGCVRRAQCAGSVDGRQTAHVSVGLGGPNVRTCAELNMQPISDAFVVGLISRFETVARPEQRLRVRSGLRAVRRSSEAVGRQLGA